MKDAGTGMKEPEPHKADLWRYINLIRKECEKKQQKKYRRAALVRAEKYQAHYFQYTSLGLFAWIMPLKMLRYYMEKRFFEQPENHRRAFERMTVQNRTRRERAIKKAVKAK
jgi:hypothetical protein